MLIDNRNNIQFIRGDTETLTVSVKDAEGNPYNLQELDVLTLTVKGDLRKPAVALTLTADVSGTITFNASDTLGIPAGEYWYSITLTNSNGDVHTIIPPAKFTLRAGVLNQ